MGRRRRGEVVNGWVNLNKPEGLTSTQAVNQVRRYFNARKAGHSGTLDPLASGILPIALGEATKLVNHVIDSHKIYQFDVTWGEERDTDDMEGSAVRNSDQPPPAAEAMQSALADYTGAIEQIPPQYSAIRVNGERAYDRARRGESTELAPRSVQIYRFEMKAPLEPVPEGEDGATAAVTGFEVACGRGVYVRSLARDLGRQFGCFGYVSALRRSQVGPFSLENAISLENLLAFGHKEALETVVKPVEMALADIPALSVTEAEAERIRCGQTVFVPSELEGAVYVKAKARILAIAELEKGRLNPVRVFNL